MFHSTAIFLLIPFHDTEMILFPYSYSGMSSSRSSIRVKSSSWDYILRIWFRDEGLLGGSLFPSKIALSSLVLTRFPYLLNLLKVKFPPWTNKATFSSGRHSSELMNPLVWGEWRMHTVSEKLLLSLPWFGVKTTCARTSLPEPVKSCHENAE